VHVGSAVERAPTSAFPYILRFPPCIKHHLPPPGVSPGRLSIARRIFPPGLLRGATALLPDPPAADGWGVGGSGAEAPELLVERAEGAEGGWTLVGLCNWGDRADARAVPLERVGVRAGRGEVVRAFECWEGRASAGWAGAVSVGSVAAHSVAVVAIRVRPVNEVLTHATHAHTPSLALPALAHPLTLKRTRTRTHARAHTHTKLHLPPWPSAHSIHPSTHPPIHPLMPRPSIISPALPLEAPCGCGPLSACMHASQLLPPAPSATRLPPAGAAVT
jgi:hypothetical protein